MHRSDLARGEPAGRRSFSFHPAARQRKRPGVGTQQQSCHEVMGEARCMQCCQQPARPTDRPTECPADFFGVFFSELSGQRCSARLATAAFLRRRRGAAQLASLARLPEARLLLLLLLLPPGGGNARSPPGSLAGVARPQQQHLSIFCRHSVRGRKGKTSMGGEGGNGTHVITHFAWRSGAWLRPL